MNKKELSAKWSKYCDTDKLVTDTIALLKKYRHKCSEKGVCALLDTYFTNKEPLIKLFMTSEHYIGDMRICMQKEFERKLDWYAINSFFNNSIGKFSLNELLKFVDDDGKTLIDYMNTGKKTISIADLPSDDNQTKKVKKLRAFDYSNGATKETSAKYHNVIKAMGVFSTIYHTTIQDDYKFEDGLEVKRGTKTSRAFNAMCVHYGVDKLNPQIKMVEDAETGEITERKIYPYNKLFAQYSDLVSGLARKMHFIISLNPLDYLTMSIGVNWHSCHSINGYGYQGGCLSYMLDKTSMITFVVDNIDAPIHTIPKVYRQMYHYENNMFIQNRLYPQGNDGATNLYDKFRGFIMEEFNGILNTDGKWMVESRVTPYVSSTGAHYRDYNYNRNCSAFYPATKKRIATAQHILIGHPGICVNCGKEYTHNGRLNHANTADCM